MTRERAAVLVTGIGVGQGSRVHQAATVVTGTAAHRRAAWFRDSDS